MHSRVVIQTAANDEYLLKCQKNFQIYCVLVHQSLGYKDPWETNPYDIKILVAKDNNKTLICEKSFLSGKQWILCNQAQWA